MPALDAFTKRNCEVHRLNLQTLISQYGDPYYLSKDGAVTALNQAFWASLHQAEHIQLFEPDEREFYRYNPESGLYSVISEDTIKQEIAARILDVSREQSLPSLNVNEPTAVRIISAQLKGISEKECLFVAIIRSFIWPTE